MFILLLPVTAVSWNVATVGLIVPRSLAMLAFLPLNPLRLLLYIVTLVNISFGFLLLLTLLLLLLPLLVSVTSSQPAAGQFLSAAGLPPVPAGPRLPSLGKDCLVSCSGRSGRRFPGAEASSPGCCRMSCCSTGSPSPGESVACCCSLPAKGKPRNELNVCGGN